MQSRASVLSATALLLAAVGISSLSKPFPSRAIPAAAKTAVGNSGRPQSSSTPVPSACEEIKNRLEAFVVSTPKGHWAFPSSCYRGKESGKENAPGMDFAIATAPDPISTHLPLLFDRVIETIQQAAEDNGYVYDSSWFPWSESYQYPRLADELEAQQDQASTQTQPGVLVFRKSNGDVNPGTYCPGALVVFVVSELPTAGIDQVEFENAVAWIQSLSGLDGNKRLAVLGPMFSGSLPSLERSLRLAGFSGSSQVRVSSGTVSSGYAYKIFQHQLGQMGTFDTALEDDSLTISRFCKYITSQGYQTNRVAILSEDETAFGSEHENTSEKNVDICTDSGNPIYLYYPRDIATLRSAYETQSIFTSNQKLLGAEGSTTTLREDLSESTTAKRDTVRSYSDQLAPLAQESLLLAIADELRERKTQFVVLRSTNSLDQIFLTQFLRRSLPGARVVIDGADLLFRRGSPGTSLRGTLLLSTYPLLVWQPEWTSASLGKGGEAYRVFEEDAIEGLYIAARGLFPNQSSDVPIANYAPPAWARTAYNDDADQRPPTWLSVIGHRELWPVAVLNEHTLNQGKLDDSILLTAAARHDHRLVAVAGSSSPMNRLPVEFWLLVVLCIAWSAFHFLSCSRGSVSPIPSLFRRTQFAPIDFKQHSALVGFGSLLVATTATILGATSGLMSTQIHGAEEMLLGLGLFAMWVLAGLGCAVNYLLPLTCGSDSAVRVRSPWHWVVGGTCVLLFALAVLLQMSLLDNLRNGNGIPAFWRSVHLFSGVSPLVPQLFLIAGMYAWFWFNLRGLALFGDDRPLLPKREDLKSVDGTPVMVILSRENAELSEKQALPLNVCYSLSLLVIAVVTASLCALALGGPWLYTLGEQRYGILIFIWVAVCISLVLSDAAQCWSVWKSLQVLLVHLDRLPLRRTLNSLRGLSWRSVWAMSGNVLEQRYCLISRQIEALTHLANELGTCKPRNPKEKEIYETLRSRIAAFQESNVKQLREWYGDLVSKPIETVAPLQLVQQQLASLAGFTLSMILRPSWATETDSLVKQPLGTQLGEPEQRFGPLPSPGIAPHIRAAEEFVALPYIGFIQNILGRMRTIAFSSLFLFVAMTLCISSYPFSPLPMLGGIFLTVFLLTGTTMILIYAGMHRDATLSYITDTNPGELGGAFWRQLVTFGVGPLLGLLTTLFPSITDFVASWILPSTQALK